MLIRSLLFALAFVPLQGTTLRWTPKEGDTIKYQTVGELNAGGIVAKITQINTQKVIRVDPDGGFVVQATPSEGKVVYAGQEMSTPGITTLTTYGPGGELKEIQGDKADATAYRMANLTEFHAPTKSVAIGDSWPAEGKADPKTGAVAWKAEYKVVGEEQIGPFPAIKLDVSARETEGTEAGKASGSMWVGKDGVLVRADLVWSNVTVPGSPALVSGKLIRTRIE